MRKINPFGDHDSARDSDGIANDFGHGSVSNFITGDRGVLPLIGGTIDGTAGNDLIHEAGDGAPPPPGPFTANTSVTEGDDVIDISQGGIDTVFGDGGNDTIYVGGALTAADRIDGGNGGNDTLQLDGDYSAGVTLGDLTITNVENIQFFAGHFEQAQRLVGQPG